MKKNIKVICWIEMALLSLNLIFYLSIKVIPSDYNLYLVITFLLFMIIPLRLFFGKTKDSSYYMGYTIRTVITVLMAIGITIYLLGLLLGFTKGYSYTFNNLIRLIVPTIVLSITIEYFRFIVVKNSYNNIKSIVIFTILLTILEVFAITNFRAINTSYKVFVYICITVLPVFADQLLGSYLNYKVGMTPSLIYRLIIRLYAYVLPITPNLGNYLLSFVKVLTPFIIFYIINRAMVEDEKSKKIITNDTLKLFSIPIILFLIILVILVSGVFNNRLIAIASDSMNPTYSRGDVVLIEYMKPNELRKGDILVFDHENIIVTHRIVDIKKKKDTYYFTTKGDANDKPDSFVSTNENVIGKVDYAIKYIGYPTVLINELFERS